jgi:hypothetical protein
VVGREQRTGLGGRGRCRSSMGGMRCTEDIEKTSNIRKLVRLVGGLFASYGVISSPAASCYPLSSGRRDV